MENPAAKVEPKKSRCARKCSQPNRQPKLAGYHPDRPTVNGSSTPRASREVAATQDRPASRQYLDASKPPALPRKLSPPSKRFTFSCKSAQSPRPLVTRAMASGIVRGYHRDHPWTLVGFLPPRDARPAYRTMEPTPPDDYDRYGRRHERPEPIPARLSR